MEKVSGAKIFRKRFWVVGDFACLELSLPWSNGGRAAGCSPCSSARVCVNLLGALAMQKVFKLITEVVQDRTGLTAQAGLPASTGQMDLSRDRQTRMGTDGPEWGRQMS